jgi:hypothetical protein
VCYSKLYIYICIYIYIYICIYIISLGLNDLSPLDPDGLMIQLASGGGGGGWGGLNAV